MSEEDPSKMDCFYISLHLMRDHTLNRPTLNNILFADGKDVPECSPLLVHGIVNDRDGKPIKHAWIQYGDWIIEYSGVNEWVGSTNEYKNAHNPQIKATFTPIETMENLMRGCSVGFWGDPDSVQTISPVPTYEEVITFDFLGAYLKEAQHP